MKTIIRLAATAAFACAAISLQAQDCTTYFPMTEGAILEIHTFNGTGKLETSATHKVIKRTISTGHVEVTVNMSHYDEKKKEHLGEHNYTVMCDSGKYTVEMTAMLNPDQLKKTKGNEVKVNSDKLEIPSNPRTGQELNGGKVEIVAIVDGADMGAVVQSTVSNRKVEAIETITTPAGTFECIKITYNIESKVLLFKSTGRAEEWYAKGVGLVQSKTYDSKGKQQTLAQLVKVTKP